MTKNPKTIGRDLLASEALEILNSSKITTLIVTDAGQAGRHRASARSAARGRGVGRVRSASLRGAKREAIRRFRAAEAMDCFASLAMTGLDHAGNLAAFSSSGNASPFARYDTVR